MLPVCVYSCESEVFPNQGLERVCLHYKVLFHWRQFLSPLYERRQEVSLMLISNLPIHCHYNPRQDEHIQSAFFQGFPRHSKFKSFQKVYPSPCFYRDGNGVFVPERMFDQALR